MYSVFKSFYFNYLLWYQKFEYIIIKSFQIVILCLICVGYRSIFLGIFDTNARPFKSLLSINFKLISNLYKMCK